LDEFDVTSLAGVFEAHYVQYTTRIPFVLTVLSGWPLFRIYSGLVDSVRARLDFPHLPGQGICGGAVQMGDVYSAIRILHGTEGLNTDDSNGVLVILARILTNAEDATNQLLATGKAEWDHVEDDCNLAIAFAHLGRALALASLRDLSTSTANGITEYFGKLLRSIEAAEDAWHLSAEAAVRNHRQGHNSLLRIYAGGWPIWQMLDRLQRLTSQRPWALRCRSFDEKAPLCPACAVPQQAEWNRESQWVSALAAGGARGEFEAVHQPRLRVDLLQDMAGSTASAAARALDNRLEHAGEAWATLLSDDDAIANEAARRALIVYAEAVRVMARSVRRAEAKVASDASKDSAPPRPFLVLMTEAALTSDVRDMLEGDGLTPLVLPSFSSEGIVVPSRRKQRGETGAGEEVDAEENLSEKVELSWWLKIKLWKLTEYRRIVYLDADILVHRPIDELFALPDEVVLAAPAHLSRDGKGSEISVGVMSLRPDRRIYDALVAFLSAAAEHFVTAVRSVDQMLQHSFFARHFTWGGYPRWEAGSGQFLGCMEDLPLMSPGEVTDSDLFVSSLGKVCVLPPRYDFCVSYPALVAGMDSPEFQEAELAVQFPQPGEQPLENNFEGLLRARLLHWTGPRRKPWMHYLSLSRTTFDNLWWQAHTELCEEAESRKFLDKQAKPMHPMQPCRFNCESL